MHCKPPPKAVRTRTPVPYFGNKRGIAASVWTRLGDVTCYVEPFFGAGAVLLEPLSGDCFLFVNARCNRAKVLLYDGTGLCIYHKRLERGRFAAPWHESGDGALKMTLHELGLFLEGCRLVGHQALSPPAIGKRRVEMAA